MEQRARFAGAVLTSMALGFVGTAAFAQESSNQKYSGRSGDQQTQTDHSQHTQGSQGQPIPMRGTQARHGASGQMANMTPDKMFVHMAAVDGMAEVRLAELAREKSQNQQVRQLADRLIQDHTKSNQQLLKLAPQEGLEPPKNENLQEHTAQLPPERQMVLQFFQSLQGSEFDQEFLSHVKAAHAKEISKFTDKARLAKDDKIRQFAAQQLPILREHQQMALAAAASSGMGSDTAQPASGRLGAETSTGHPADAHDTTSSQRRSTETDRTNPNDRSGTNPHNRNDK